MTMPECPGCNGPTERIECGNFHCTIGGAHQVCISCDVSLDEWTPEITAAVAQLRERMFDGPPTLRNGRPDWFLVASTVIDAVMPMVRAEAEKALADAFRASVLTGSLALPTEEFHRRAEALLGREVMTHEFGDVRLWDQMRERLSTSGD
jgi:hypothetical protein